IIPLGQLAIFAVLVTVAILLRRRPDAHKRLMLLATIHLTPPAIMRIGYNVFHIASPPIVVATLVLLVAACIALDWGTRRKVHPVFAIAAPMTVLSFPMRMAFSHTDAWLSFAKWISGTA